MRRILNKVRAFEKHISSYPFSLLGLYAVPMTTHTSCGTAHDPEPYLTYTMQTGQNGWAGKPQFKPREGYCQSEVCYRQAKEPCTCQLCCPADFG